MAFFLPLIGIEIAEAALGVETVSNLGILADIGIEGVTAYRAGNLIETGVGAALEAGGAERIGGLIGTGGGVESAVTEAIEASQLAEGLSSSQLLDVLPIGDEASGLQINENALRMNTIGDVGGEGVPIENVEQELFGSNVVLDDTPDILGTSILDLTQTGIMQQLENSLADIGITKELLGETNWNHLLFLISGGALTVDEVIKLYSENNLEDLVGTQIDDIMKTRNGLLNPQGLIYIDALGNPINITDMLNGNIKDIIDPYYIGYSTGKLACSTAWEMAKSNNNVAIDKNLLFSTLKAIQKNDEYAFIARKMNQYMLKSSYIEDPLKYSNKYDLYYDIYDGNYMELPHYEDDGFVHAIDETGKSVVYNGPKGVQQFLGLEVNNPTLHGVYVGPLSPNNALPIDKFDTSAYFHDVGYQEGWFRSNEDLKLISRVQHLINEHSEEFDSLTILKMKFTVLWFSYPGVFLASLVDNKLSDLEHSQLLTSDTGSFFDMIMGTYDRPNQRNNLNLPEEYYFLRIKARSLAELQFWAGLREAVDQQYKYYSEIYLKEQALNELNSLIIRG
jgi:hypothetical protein